MSDQIEEPTGARAKAKPSPFTWLRPEIGSLAMVLSASALTLGFAWIAEEVGEGETSLLDDAILSALRQPGDFSRPIGPQWLEAAMIELTSLGGYAVLTLVTIAVAAYLLLSNRVRDAALVVVAIAGGAVLSNLLKLGYARPRPDLVGHLVNVSSYSFPSGHALLSAVTYLTLGALLAPLEVRKAVRVYVMGVAVMLALTIGFSRVYLGVHYPTDVLAGWSFGSAWALLCLFVARMLGSGREELR